MDWRGRELMLSIIVALLVVPFEAIAIPLLFVVNLLPWVDIGSAGIELRQSWLNSYHVQILPFVADAFSIFLFYQFFRDIPREFDEAAVIDGATPFQIYRMVIMPLAKPVVASVAILQFQGPLERLSLAGHRGARPGQAAAHGRHHDVLHAEPGLGADPLLRGDDHAPGAAGLHHLRALVHPERHGYRCQRMTTSKSPPRLPRCRL
jgi:signal transduction histidine kinase